MNQVFDINRFALLVSKHWSENRRKYLLAMGAIAGLLFFWYSFLLLVDENTIALQVQAGTYFVGLAFGGCLYGSVLFSEFSSGPKAMNYLSFPASHFEKLVCGLLYGVVLFLIAYTAIFYLVDAAMVAFSNSLATSSNPDKFVQPAKVLNIFGPNNNGVSAQGKGPNPLHMFLLIYLAVQSAYILGSVYFVKFSFIKTTIALACVALIITLFVAKVLDPMLPENGSYSGLTSLHIYGGKGFDGAGIKVVSLPDWIGNALSAILKYAFAPLFWIVTYFRFKEKEV